MENARERFHSNRPLPLNCATLSRACAGTVLLTVDTYGRWLPMGNRDAVDRLDDANRFGEGGSKTVVNSGAEQREVLQVLGGFGSPGRTRTYSLRINSPPLHH